MHILTAKVLLHILRVSLQSTRIQWNQSHNYITHVKKVRQYLYLAGSNPAEAVKFLRVKKSSARLPSEGK